MNMATEINKDGLGAGWAFPLKIDHRGGIALSRSEGGIEEGIRLILGTARGERRMRPNFGCDIHTLVFSPNNPTTWGLACHYVEDALAWWEPRIEVLKVEAQPDPDDASRLLISIGYRVKATNDARNIVYPFYLMGRS
jgi:phage baseplate assembly protein W